MASELNLELQTENSQWKKFKITWMNNKEFKKHDYLNQINTEIVARKQILDSLVLNDFFNLSAHDSQIQELSNQLLIQSKKIVILQRKLLDKNINLYYKKEEKQIEGSKQTKIPSNIVNISPSKTKLQQQNKEWSNFHKNSRIIDLNLTSEDFSNIKSKQELVSSTKANSYNPNPQKKTIHFVNSTSFNQDSSLIKKFKFNNKEGIFKEEQNQELKKEINNLKNNIMELTSKLANERKLRIEKESELFELKIKEKEWDKDRNKVNLLKNQIEEIIEKNLNLYNKIKIHKCYKELCLSICKEIKKFSEITEAQLVNKIADLRNETINGKKEIINFSKKLSSKLNISENGEIISRKSSECGVDQLPMKESIENQPISDLFKLTNSMKSIVNLPHIMRIPRIGLSKSSKSLRLSTIPEKSEKENWPYQKNSLNSLNSLNCIIPSDMKTQTNYLRTQNQIIEIKRSNSVILKSSLKGNPFGSTFLNDYEQKILESKLKNKFLKIKEKYDCVYSTLFNLYSAMNNFSQEADIAINTVNKIDRRNSNINLEEIITKASIQEAEFEKLKLLKIELESNLEGKTKIIYLYQFRMKEMNDEIKLLNLKLDNLTLELILEKQKIQMSECENKKINQIPFTNTDSSYQVAQKEKMSNILKTLEMTPKAFLDSSQLLQEKGKHILNLFPFNFDFKPIDNSEIKLLTKNKEHFSFSINYNQIQEVYILKKKIQELLEEKEFCETNLNLANFKISKLEEDLIRKDNILTNINMKQCNCNKCEFLTSNNNKNGNNLKFKMSNISYASNYSKNSSLLNDNVDPYSIDNGKINYRTIICDDLKNKTIDKDSTLSNINVSKSPSKLSNLIADHKLPYQNFDHHSRQFRGLNRSAHHSKILKTAKKIANQIPLKDNLKYARSGNYSVMKARKLNCPILFNHKPNLSISNNNIKESIENCN